MLIRLGYYLVHRYKEKFDEADLEEATQLLQRACVLSPNRDAENLDLFIAHLGFGYQTRYSHTGEAGLLDESIRLYRDALKLRPKGNMERPFTLYLLAGALLTRSRDTGEIPSLMGAIDALEEIV